MPLSRGLTPVEDSSRQLMHCDVIQRLPRPFVDRMLNEPMHTIKVRESFHQVILAFSDTRKVAAVPPMSRVP